MGPPLAKAPAQDSKRRQGSRTSAPTLTSRASEQQQQLLHHQQKLSFPPPPSASHELARECGNLDLSPHSKRRKLDHDRRRRPSVAVLADRSTPPPPPAARPVTAETMYNFSTPGSAAGNAIDLSLSPSRRRRISSVSKVEVASGKTGAKKLVVKNFRTAPKSNPDQYCEGTTQQLDEALTAIFTSQRPALSNEELYRGCENVCKLGKADQLAAKVKDRISHHVSKDLRTTVATQTTDESVTTLESIVTAWRHWRRQLNIIRQIFAFLDRSYLLEQRTSLERIGFDLFNINIFQPFNSSILAGVSELLYADRTGKCVNNSSDMFNETLKMAFDLGTYTSGLEERLLAESQTYIANFAEEQSAKLELAEYVDASMDLMKRESLRCEQFSLPRSTTSDLLTILEHQLVERRIAELTNADAIADLLDENQQESLARLYSLLQLRQLGNRVKPAFGQWIEDTGSNIIFNEKEQDQMVVRLLDLKQRLDRIWRLPFQKNDELGIQLRESFANFMNKTKKSSGTWNTDNSKPGEMIAKYVDHLLRAGAKAIPASLATKPSLPKEEADEDDREEVDEDAELNSQLDQVLDLFRFLQGKAVFEAFYKKDLARRLLLGRSADADAERGMLTRLKNECGAGFTQNLEQMFKDIELGRDEMSSYKTRIDAAGSRPPIDLSVNVLSAAAWPTYPEIPVVIPSDLKRTLDGFEQHYQTKHTGRKLQWRHALAHCQMRATFPKGKKEMVVSSFQAIIMLMFNKLPCGARLSYASIKAESGLPDVDAKRTLQSLACAKLRPLTKYPRGKDIADTDEFSVNEDFSHERFRFKINQLQAKETKEENKATHEQVAQDRKYETQAAIVRIMKTRKTITHAELIAETIKATSNRGVLQPGEIKKQIDALIEKEYMERAEGNTYAYLA